MNPAERVNQELAPIVLFVYNRPAHTKRTLDALAANDLASQSKLIVYCDGPRSKRDTELVAEVRAIVRDPRCFSSVEIYESGTNVGLASSIVSGVTSVCSRFGRVIVMEDDLVTSRAFLTFMNDALNRYEAEARVWHISGWNYPIAADGLGDAFLVRIMNCWGWATWQDRWQQFEKNTKALLTAFTREDIKRFTLDGVGDFWKQVQLNASGQIDTWAVYWYATIFRNNGLCLNPAKSYVLNIGHDGSGTHRSSSSGVYDSILSEEKCVTFPDCISENQLAVRKIGRFLKSLKPSLLKRIKQRLAKQFVRTGNRT